MRAAQIRLIIMFGFPRGLNIPLKSSIRALFQARTNILGCLPELLPSRLLPITFSLRFAKEIYEVVISRSDLDRRESSAPPPFSRSLGHSKANNYMVFIRTVLYPSQIGITDVKFTV
jgi:hypothetical protein